MKYILMCEQPDLSVDVLGYFDKEHDAKDAVDLLNKTDKMCEAEIAEEFEDMLCDTDDKIDEAIFIKERHPDITIESLSLAYKYYVLRDIPIYYYTPTQQLTLEDLTNEKI